MLNDVSSRAYIVMAYIGMAYIVMAYNIMAYIVITTIVLAYIVMTNIVMAYIVMAADQRPLAAQLSPGQWLPRFRCGRGHWHLCSCGLDRYDL